MLVCLLHLCAAQRPHYRAGQEHRAAQEHRTAQKHGTAPALRVRQHNTPAELKRIRYQIEQQNELVGPVEPSPQSQAGFEWGSLAGVAMKLLMGGPVEGAGERADPIAQLAYMTLLHQNGELTWPKALSLAMEVALSLLSGPDRDTIDRRDTPPSPMENILSAVIAYVTGLEDQEEVNFMARQASEVLGLLASLLDALRTSFSRSLQGRSLSHQDWHQPWPQALAMATGLTQTYSSADASCQQRRLCDANTACGAPGTGRTLCQMATYGGAVVLERLSRTPRDLLTAAGRAGRDGQPCHLLYDGCNRL